MTSDPSKVNGPAETARFSRLGFDRFGELARDPNLTVAEKMGCARGQREGFDQLIWESILERLPRMSAEPGRILDVGSGCGDVARNMIANAEARGHRLTMVDHREMLDQLPPSKAVTRVEGRFPDAMPPEDDGYDMIVVYSVLHAVIVDANPFAFLDDLLARLNPGGRLLVGDIPNVSKLRRFLASEAGAAYHREYMRTDEAPVVPPFAMATDRVDDGMLIGLMMRARLAGFDAYVLPQPPELAFANRREDLLIARP